MSMCMHWCPTLRALPLSLQLIAKIPRPIGELPSLKLPASSACLDSPGVRPNPMQQGLEPALLFYCQVTFGGTVFAVASGNTDLQAQKSKTHISLPSLTVCCFL
ncbi:hypothetical protein FQA47_002147 [Oryzias melastigma]|uniref:Uncharacterized protein n=1 Tax=Oryzias melastigma TaxID=30732 RepID=A0A834C3T3_ORYME|nr:hypothetical protein FQA47_002147 [Oryzias melastigma]